jgi:uncharacterized RDD family membrane protein YckC/cytoskeletal protein CcmA (bactofilin family)
VCDSLSDAVRATGNLKVNAMKISIAKLLLGPAVALLLMALPVASLQASTVPANPPAQSAPIAAKDVAAPPKSDDEQSDEHGNHGHRIVKIEINDDGHADNSIVAIGHNAMLEAGKQSDAVVAIFGSASSDGDVSQAVVSLFGDTRVTGTVGDSAVAVLGDVYVDGKVGDSVVAVLGNIELGPHADVSGDLSTVGGTLTRDPGAQVRGTVSTVQLPVAFGGGQWIRTWISHCLMLGRPLAFAHGLDWAWSLALGFLVLYLLIALLFHRGVDRCVATLETHPGTVTLTALITLLLLPVLFVLLCVTVIGIPLIPFLWFGWWLATLFGKCVVLTWIGRRLIQLFGRREPVPAVAAVLLGGAIVLLLYTVPVVGFITFKLLGLLGRGAVLVTLVQIYRARPNGGAARRPVAPSPAVPPSPAAEMGAASAEAGSAEAGAAAASAEAAAAYAAPAAAAEPLVSGAASLPRAGFWLRMGALFVDAVIIGIVLSPLRHHGAHDVMLITLAIYGAVMWKLKGTTIGGVLCGLQVVRLDGRPVDWGTSIVRALSCFLSLVVLGLGFIWIAIDRDRQAWHDKIAGTVVVRPPKGVSLI